MSLLLSMFFCSLSPQRSLFVAKIGHIDDDQPDSYIFETSFMLKDQRTITVETTFAQMETDEKQASFLMTARDVTEKKRIEAQAKMQQEQLMQTNKIM